MDFDLITALVLNVCHYLWSRGENVQQNRKETDVAVSKNDNHVIFDPNYHVIVVLN